MWPPPPLLCLHSVLAHLFMLHLPPFSCVHKPTTSGNSLGSGMKAHHYSHISRGLPHALSYLFPWLLASMGLTHSQCGTESPTATSYSSALPGPCPRTTFHDSCFLLSTHPAQTFLLRSRPMYMVPLGLPLDAQWVPETQHTRHSSSEEGVPPATHPTKKKSLPSFLLHTHMVEPASPPVVF